MIGLPSLMMERQEILAAVGDHAAYPTTSTTLCGKPVDLFDQADPGGPLPACLECARVAVAFHGIDASAPEHWVPADELAEVAA